MSHTQPKRREISAPAALKRLVDGNKRLLAGQARFPTLQKELLVELARAQEPFATILGCSDSRMPPELLFDTGFGELFVIRVAGNVVSPGVAASLQYAGTHLHTHLFVVLGHEGCGAINATLNFKKNGVREGDHLQHLVEEHIMPGLSEPSDDWSPEQQLSLAVEENVRWSVKQIADSPEGRARIVQGKYTIVGAVGDIATGIVRFLPDTEASLFK